METKLNFEELPAAVASIQSNINRLEKMLTALVVENLTEDERPLSCRGAAEVLTEIEGKPVTTTGIYNRVAQRSIPFHKRRNRLFFYRSELMGMYRKDDGLSVLTEQTERQNVVVN